MKISQVKNRLHITYTKVPPPPPHQGEKQEKQDVPAGIPPS